MYGNTFGTICFLSENVLSIHKELRRECGENPQHYPVLQILLIATDGVTESLSCLPMQA